MAGRGTDILLGGNPEYLTKNFLKAKGLKPNDPNYPVEYKNIFSKFKKETTEEHRKVVELGGLHIIGTERHEARRIDNQLRGRSGRQGDPGSSRFYVSLEDDLMRLFGSDRLIGIMEKLGLEEGQRIEHRWVTKSIEIAQKRVESYNFEIRKQLLEFDNVMNKQREVIYSQRRMVLEGKDLKDEVFSYISDSLEKILDLYISEDISSGDWNFEGLKNHLRLKFGLALERDLKDKKRGEIKDLILKEITSLYEKKEADIGKKQMRDLERIVFLQVIDSKWKDHLYAMDNLREGIGLRAYGQKDPLVEYQNEAFNMFEDMIEKIKEEIVEYIFKIQVMHEERWRGVFISLPQEFIHQQVCRFERPKEEPLVSPQQLFLRQRDFLKLVVMTPVLVEK
jgi:preprotein translocase subunit SecA